MENEYEWAEQNSKVTPKGVSKRKTELERGTAEQINYAFTIVLVLKEAYLLDHGKVIGQTEF